METPSRKGAKGAKFREEKNSLRISPQRRRVRKGKNFCPIGRRRLGKNYSSNLSNVFVCRRLPTNKKVILCDLCGSTLLTTLSPSKGASAVNYHLR